MTLEVGMKEFNNFLYKGYMLIPNEIRRRPSDLAIPVFLAILVVSVWLNLIPPSVMFFSEARYELAMILSEIYLMVGAILITGSMILNVKDRVSAIKYRYVERLGWWAIFSGSAVLAIFAIAFSPDQDMGWPTAAWTVFAISALLKIILMTGDRRSWTR
jgi:hypothetical protein